MTNAGGAGDGIIERIIDWCARRRGFVFLVTAVAVVWSAYTLGAIRLDALPDLSDTQVIIYAKWDRPPQIIENQVTYPLITALLGAPHVKDIRAFTDYGFSYTYVIFEDGTDIYWARSRVLEYLSKVTSQLPAGVKVELGPDATGLGWVYEYALVDTSGKNSLADLRRFQDWTLRYALQSVKGVSEVASIGGFVNQFQVTVNPNALRAYDLSLADVIMAIRGSNQEMGARLVEIAGKEYMVSVRGYIATIEDIEDTLLMTMGKTPVRLKDVARVTMGPDIRRGIVELDGTGETVGGIVVMRYQENALAVIDRVKQRISEVKLPEGVTLVPTYDRSELIKRSIATLRKQLVEEMIVVALIIFIFLLHFTSSLIPVITLPVATLLSFPPMYYLGISSNIMSLGGIAIAIGALVDASIVMIESSHRKVATLPAGIPAEERREHLITSLKEVGRPAFFSLLVIAVAFIPIFSLEGMEGRLFRPLAFTKNFAMFFGAVLAVTLVPALTLSLLRVEPYRIKNRLLSRITNGIFAGKIKEEGEHPVSRFLFRLYTPVVKGVLRRPVLVILVTVVIFLASMPLFLFIGKEFMPPLNEGVILYMPTFNPGLSITEAQKLLGVQDAVIKGFPEVRSVFGKAGRAETATDPAPFSMMETVIVLRPMTEWRTRERWYSNTVPDLLKGPFRALWPDRMTWEELLADMNEALRIPGQVNSFTMPIKGRIDMLSTGIRTPVGIKIYGDDLAVIERIGADMEMALKTVGGTRSVYAEKTAAGYFLDVTLDRRRLARYGLSVQEVQMVLASAVGGETVSEVVAGRERYTVSVRYPRELRDDPDRVGRIALRTPTGAWVTVSDVAKVTLAQGPGMIRDENGKLSGYVFVDMEGVDIGTYVESAKEKVAASVSIPAGYTYAFSGQYESMERVKNKMIVVIPITLCLILFLIYLNTRAAWKTIVVALAIPLSLVGVIWFLLALGYNMSVGVWSGIIALLGVDAETGIFMLMYLDLSYSDMMRRKERPTLADLREAIHEGAVLRIRPKLMTILTTFIGLLPILWAQSHEVGADVLKRIAAPMMGGIVTSFVSGLVVYPAIYYLVKRRSMTDYGKGAALSA
jgi:copper/silver efflux system protein